MKTKVYLGIALRIIALFAVAMAFTYIPDYLRDFFGDKLRSEPDWTGPDKWYDWGVRHYWYFWMVALLFILSMINVIVSIVNLVNKEYDL